jgi:hypothetical protein
MRRELVAVCIVAGCIGLSAVAASGQQVDAAQQVLEAGRRAYNERQYPVAAERFREFVKANPNHKELAGAELGLGAALLELPEPDYAGAVDALTVAAGKQDLEQRGLALYYLGVALRGQAGALGPKGVAKLEEAIARLGEATGVLEKKAEAVKAGAQGELPLEVEWAARARAEWADALLEGGKFEQAAGAARGLAESPRLAGLSAGQCAVPAEGLAGGRQGAGAVGAIWAGLRAERTVSAGADPSSVE